MANPTTITLPARPTMSVTPYEAPLERGAMALTALSKCCMDTRDLLSEDIDGDARRAVATIA